MVVRSSLLAFACGIMGCQSYPFVPYTPASSPPGTQGPGPGTTVAEQFTVGPVATTDILFVIDNSGSMADKQARLASNAQQFINTLVASGNPFRIGIVTTDVVNPADQGRLRAFAPGLLWLDAPDPRSPTAAQDGQNLINRFVSVVSSLGVQGDSRESGFMAALSALGAASPQDPNVLAHNAGFVRDTADLAVVVLSDEDDCSRTATSLAGSPVTAWTPEQCYVQNLETERLQGADVVQALAAVKGADVRRVRAGLIVAGVTGSDGSFSPRSCLMQGVSPSTACGCWLWAGTGTEPQYCEFNGANGQPCGVSTTQTCDVATMCIDPNNACIAQCSAMGGYRYKEFADALTAARANAGASAGAVMGTICENSFADSLLAIASNVVTPSCFNLAQVPAPNAQFAVSVQLLQRNQQLGPSEPISELDPRTPGACRACDGQCAAGAFTVDGATLCMGCGLFLNEGDVVHVVVTTPGQ